jgi:hypothetical protein
MNRTDYPYNYPYTESLKWQPITSDMRDYFAEKLMQ